MRISNAYLSRYYSVSLCYLCLTQIQSHELSMSTRHQLVFYQRQTNGRDLGSYQCRHRHQLLINQCQTNQHNLMCYRCQPDTSSYSINVIPMGAISFQFVCFKENRLLSLGSNQIGVSISTEYNSSCQIRVRF